MGNRVDRATNCMGLRAGLIIENVEMIGDREIDVLLLPEMSRAERAGRAKKNEQFSLFRPQAAPPRRGSAIGRSSILATLAGKSVYNWIQLISCQPRLGTRPGGLEEAQAVTHSGSG